MPPAHAPLFRGRTVAGERESPPAPRVARRAGSLAANGDSRGGSSDLDGRPAGGQGVVDLRPFGLIAGRVDAAFAAAGVEVPEPGRHLPEEQAVAVLLEPAADE